MRRLLWTELRYSRAAWGFAYAVCLVLFVAALLRDKTVVAFMMNSSLAYVISLGIMGNQADAELRTRANALLPLRPRQLGWIEVAYVALFQLGMVAFWLALLAFKPAAASAPTLWAMASHNGLTLSLLTVFMIHSHLGHFGTRDYRWITYALLLALLLSVAGLVYTGRIGPVGRVLWRHYVSWSGALFSTLLWLGLSWLSVRAYEGRKSYLA